MHRHAHLTGCGAASGSTCTCETRRYWYIFLLTLLVVVVQFVGSVFSGSLALFADTTHVALDCAGALISVYVAHRVKNHEDPARLRLRWMRVSGFALLFALLWIAYEAVERFFHPQSVRGLSVMFVAAIGGAVNYWQHTLVPHDHTATSHAQRLHVLGDLATSIIVLIGGLLMWVTSYQWIDPALSLLVVAVVGVLTIRMLRTPAHTHECGHSHHY